MPNYSDEYVEMLEKQCDLLARHIQFLCLDAEALPSYQDIYGRGAAPTIEAINKLDETRKEAEKVIGEHYEKLNGFNGH